MAGVTSSSCSTYIHTLFSIENENMNVPDEVSDAALEAAVDFVSVLANKPLKLQKRANR